MGGEILKIAALTIAYREEKRIAKTINCLKGFIDYHLVMISQTSWSGEVKEMDKTEQIATGLGCEVILGHWNNEVEQRNLGLAILKDYDWVIIIDADEYYDPTSVKNLLQFIPSASLRVYGISTMKTYWKTPQYIIDPPESGGRLVLIKPDVKIIISLCVDESWGFLPDDIILHHYSYVRTDEEMKSKVDYFQNIEKFVPNWYENVWLKWTPEMENLHPVQPESFKKAVKCSNMMK